jgi:hypothetical protein
LAMMQLIILTAPKRKIKKVMADYNKVIELKSDNFLTYYCRGLVKRAKGDTTGAKADFKISIELNPKFPLIAGKDYFVLGNDYFRYLTN